MTENWEHRIGRDLSDTEKEIVADGENRRKEALHEALKLRKANLLAEVEKIVKEIEDVLSGKHPAAQPNAIERGPVFADGAPIEPTAVTAPVSAEGPGAVPSADPLPEEVHGSGETAVDPSFQEAAVREGGDPESIPSEEGAEVPSEEQTVEQAPVVDESENEPETHEIHGEIHGEVTDEPTEDHSEDAPQDEAEGDDEEHHEG